MLSIVLLLAVANPWFVVVDGKPTGPHDDDAVVALIAAGTIDGDTLVWSEGLAAWAPLRSQPGWAERLQPKRATPPPLPGASKPPALCHRRKRSRRRCLGCRRRRCPR